MGSSAISVQLLFFSFNFVKHACTYRAQAYNKDNKNTQEDRIAKAIPESLKNVQNNTQCKDIKQNHSTSSYLYQKLLYLDMGDNNTTGDAQSYCQMHGDTRDIDATLRGEAFERYQGHIEHIVLRYQFFQVSRCFITR